MNTTHDSLPLILIVDDNPSNLQIVGNILREHNFKIAAVESGREALDFIAKKQPDLILLDILMPEMNGFEVCRAIKTKPETADIPIIFISVLYETDDKLKGFELGGVDYITKPFQELEVIARVRTHLTLMRQQKELKETLTKFRETQNALIELERKTTIAAMATTANHEINQELTVLFAQLDIFEKSMESIHLSEQQQAMFSRLKQPILNISDILKKYRTSSNARIEKYMDRTVMVVFDEEKK